MIIAKQTHCLVLVNGLSPIRIAVLKITCITRIKQREFYLLWEKM